MWCRSGRSSGSDRGKARSVCPDRDQHPCRRSERCSWPASAAVLLTRRNYKNESAFRLVTRNYINSMPFSTLKMQPSLRQPVGWLTLPGRHSLDALSLQRFIVGAANSLERPFYLIIQFAFLVIGFQALSRPFNSHRDSTGGAIGRSSVAEATQARGALSSGASARKTPRFASRAVAATRPSSGGFFRGIVKKSHMSDLDESGVSHRLKLRVTVSVARVPRRA
jgi:hypothetical protein